MADSLEQRIRNNNLPQANMSLDEYIYINKIRKPAQCGSANHRSDSSDSGLSKFDRYKHQDDNDDDMDEDGNEVPTEMPKLVPYEPCTLPPKNSKPIHRRLGERGSVCESIHTSQMNLLKPNFKAKNRVSVQNRLGKNYVNPACVERNRIAIHALNTYARQSSNKGDDSGKALLSAFANAIERETQPKQNPDQKYDMQIQKEISSLQGKGLYYACPGAFVISSDGPGVRGLLNVPTHTTEMSMNQRFA